MTDKEVKITLTIDGIDQDIKNVDDLKKKMKDLGDQTEKTGEQATIFSDLKDRLSGMTGGVRKVIASFKTLKGAIAATGIGALLIAITSLVAYFKQSEEGSRKLAIATETLSVLFGKLTDFAASLGEKLIGVFKNPKEALLSFGNLIKQNIENRIMGMLELLPALGKAISLALSGKFKEAGKTAVDAVAKVTLGVEDITDKAVEFGEKAVEVFNEVTEAVKESVAVATQLVDAQRALRNQQQALVVENAQLNQELEKQRKIAEDTTLSYDERAAALEKVGETQIKLAENVAKQAKAEEDLLKLQIANEGNYEKREELETQLAEATAARIEAQTALNTVEQEAGKLGRELDQEELDRKRSINDILKELKLSSIEDTYEQARQELAAQEEAALNELTLLRATEEQKQELRDGFQKKREQLAEEEAKFNKDLAKATQEANLQTYSAGLSAISKLVGENTAIGKAAAVASTTIDTYVAAQKAYASQLLPGDPTSPVRAAIAAGVAVANGIANVRAILSTKTPGGGGVSGSTPSKPNIQSIDPSGAALGNTPETAGDTQTFQQTGSTGVIKAYVVAEEMSSTQEANKRIDDLARL